MPNFTLAVAVTTTDTESGDTATVTDTLAVSVTGDADTPTLTVSAASGTEDTAIALDITPALTDTDGSETLSVTVSDIPAGATLSAGTVNPDGSVTLTPAQLNGLTITPATDSTADFTLTVAATATEADSDTATTTTTLGVTVTGTAAEATLGTSAASGTEDTAIAISISVTGVESNDTASITVSDIPTGATLSAGTVNPDGSVTLTPAELTGLAITPPSDSDADFTLAVAVTTTDTESGDTATVTDTLAVSVTGDADAPTLTVNAASGTEDTAIALDITSALTDIDGSETLTVTVSDIPAGATLSDGTVNPDGSVTLTPAQLNGLTITPATDSTADFTLTVAATATEADGDTATTTTTLGVTVTGTAAEVTLGTSAAGGTEETAIALSISVTDVESNDTASVTISDIPAGATLSAGTVNPDGSVTLTPAELTGLTITPPADSSDDFTLSVAVTTTDTESGDTATVNDTLAVSVTGDADTPTLTVNARHRGTEDTAIALDITSALTDIDGSETLTVTVSDIPTGATLSAGTVNPDGSVTLTPAQLNGLTITPATDSTADFTLTVAATATEADGDTATTTTTLGVTVTGTAAEATLGTSAASGTEDTAIPLSISVTDVESNDTASVTISDIPAGASLSAGTVNPDGSVTLTPAQLNGLTVTPPADSDANFTLAVAVTTTDTESGDTATVNGSVAVAIAADADAPTLTVSTGAVSATAAVPGGTTETTLDTNNFSDTSSGFTVTARTLNQDGSLSDPSVSNIVVHNSPLGFGVQGSSSGDDDELGFDLSEFESEEIIVSLDQSVTSVDVAFAWLSTTEQASYTLFNDGIQVGQGIVTGVTDAVDPAVTFTAIGDAAFDQIVFTAPGFDDDFLINAISYETTTVATPGSITYALDIASTLTDTDGSETLAVTVSGLPNGTALSAGTVNPDGSVTLTPEQLGSLTVTAPTTEQKFDLQVTATATDGTDTETTTTTVTLDYPEATAPTLTVTVGDVVETGSTAAPVLHLDPGSNGSGVQGTTLTDAAGNTDGTLKNGAGSTNSGKFGDGISLDGSNDYIEVAHDPSNKPVNGTLSVWINPDDSFTGSIASTDSLGFDDGGHFHLYTSGGGLNLRVQDSNESVNVSGGSGISGSSGYHHVAVTWDDTTVTIYLDGTAVATETLPSGFDGVLVGNENPWTFGASQTFSADNSANFVTTHFDGKLDDIAIFDSALSAADISTLAADTPVSGFTATSGGSTLFTYDLDISTSAQSGETLSVNLTGIPDGTTLTSGSTQIQVSGGSANLTTDQLADLTLSSPNALSSDFDLTVTATATDALGQTARNVFVKTVDVAGTDSQTEAAAITGTDGDDVIVTETTAGATIDGGAGDDRIDGGAGNDTLTGGAGDDTIRTDSGGQDATTGTVQTTLLQADFTSGADGFSYSDNVFGTSNAPSASGQHSASGGQNGGGLVVNLGSLTNDDDDEELGAASGGWTTTVNVAEASDETTLTFSYKIDFPSQFESDEFAEVRVLVDGVAQSADGSGHVGRIDGSDNSGGTGWQTVTLNLGALTAGSHTITLGGFLNKFTAENEDLQITFDDLSLVGTQTGVTATNTVDGGEGDDYIIAGAGNDVIDGGAGSDTVSYAESNAGIVLDFSTGTITGGYGEGDTLTNVENVVGTNFADQITGDTDNNYIEGGAGDDTLQGSEGDDTLLGGAGDDTIQGGLNSDLLYGGSQGRTT